MAVAQLGGPSAVARRAGVSQGAVSQWTSGKSRCAAERAREVSLNTGIPLEVLRPDLWGDQQNDDVPDEVERPCADDASFRTLPNSFSAESFDTSQAKLTKLLTE
jgi:DNA-binding transcriptional regulator YdaS (Cro superfamily)